MLLSIIMPVYNSAAYLPLCLDSIVRAGLGDAELILVDDGSRDASPEIMARYAASYPFIRTLRQANAGPSAARNNGLRHSRGDFVAFLDSDDTVIPEAFAKTVSLLARYPADLWVSDFSRVADNGTVLDRICQIEPSDEPAFGGEAMLRYVSSGDCVWNVWRCIFRRAFLDEKGLAFREGFHCGEDLEFVVRALTAAKRIAFFHNPYYCYRVNYGDTLTRRYTAERVRQLTEMLKSAGDTLSGLEGESAAALRRMLAREYLLNLSLYADCLPPERAHVLEYLRGAWGLAAFADRGAYRCAAVFARCFGIPLTGRLLSAAKRGRRAIRRLKQRRERHGA